MPLRIAALLVLFAWSVTGAVHAQDPRKLGTSFVDRFDRFDGTRWYVSDGWSNGPHQNCTWMRGNLKVGPRAELWLTDRANPTRPFACAEMQTLAFYSYGAYEVRLRAAAGPGIVSAFFTYTGPPHGAGRPHDEIDLEFLGKAQRGVWLNYFRAGKDHANPVPLDFDTTVAANDYAFVWLPDSIRWFANGKLIHEVKKSAGADIPSQPQKLYISIWNGSRGQEAWLGAFAYPGTPLVAVYDYVAFTAMDDTCQFPDSIVCRKPDLFNR